MSGPRIWLPLDALQSQAFFDCGFSARALLIELASQLRSKNGAICNNGDLTTAHSTLAKHGWKDPKTIRAAAKELEDAKLILKTRQGRKPNLCNLYAVTWLPLNESNKTEISASGFPLHGYRLLNPALVTKKTAQRDSEKIPIPSVHRGNFSPSELRPP